MGIFSQLVLVPLEKAQANNIIWLDTSISLCQGLSGCCRPLVLAKAAEDLPPGIDLESYAGFFHLPDGLQHGFFVFSPENKLLALTG